MKRPGAKKRKTRVALPGGSVPDNKWEVTERDLDRAPWFRINEGKRETHDLVPTALARAGERMGEVWLWCLHCQRFFQAKDLKLDFFGYWQRCPFDDCGAAGFDVDILTWDAEKDEDPLWPQSEDALRFGLSTRRGPKLQLVS